MDSTLNTGGSDWSTWFQGIGSTLVNGYVGYQQQAQQNQAMLNQNQTQFQQWLSTQPQPAQHQAMNISPVLLLAGAGLLVYMLVKK